MGVLTSFDRRPKSPVPASVSRSASLGSSVYSARFPLDPNGFHPPIPDDRRREEGRLSRPKQNHQKATALATATTAKRTPATGPATDGLAGLDSAAIDGVIEERDTEGDVEVIGRDENGDDDEDELQTVGRGSVARSRDG